MGERVRIQTGGLRGRDPYSAHIHASSGYATLPLTRTQPTRQSPRKPLASNPNANNPSTSHPAPNRMPPTPLSNSPSASSSYTLAPRYPPQFDASHPSHLYPSALISQRPPAPPSLSASTRISTALYTPRSPYRPGEYGYNRRAADSQDRADTTSERTRIERRLFDDDAIVNKGGVDEWGRDDEFDVDMDPEPEPKRNRGSSPLQPAFEARLILRKGAPVDLISW